MRALALVSLALLALAGCGKPAATTPNAQSPAGNPPGTAGEPVTFKAPDKLTIFARRYRAARPKALILLFHQAESGKGEYATIGPRLAAAGYDTVAVDARAGGRMYGDNETVALRGKAASFLDAKQDLAAALAWAQMQKLPVVLWGSSYSAALIFPLAAEHPGQVKALLAFSPGEYFDDKTMIARAAAKVTAPVYVTVASAPDEAKQAAPILAALQDKTFYQPEQGIHGSSTLNADRDPVGAEANWQPVLAFLKAKLG